MLFTPYGATTYRVIVAIHGVLSHLLVECTVASRIFLQILLALWTMGITSSPHGDLTTVFYCPERGGFLCAGESSNSQVKLERLPALQSPFLENR